MWDPEHRKYNMNSKKSKYEGKVWLSRGKAFLILFHTISDNFPMDPQKQNFHVLHIFQEWHTLRELALLSHESETEIPLLPAK